MYPFDEADEEQKKKELEAYLLSKFGQKPEVEAVAPTSAPVQAEIDIAKQNEEELENAYKLSGFMEGANQIGSAIARQQYKPGLSSSVIEKAKSSNAAREKSAQLASQKAKSDRETAVFTAKSKKEAEEMDPNSEISKRTQLLYGEFAKNKGIPVDISQLSAKEIKEHLPKIMDQSLKQEQIIASRENAESNRKMADSYRQASLDIQKQNLSMAKDREADRKVEADFKKQELGAAQAKQLGHFKIGTEAEKQYQAAVAKGKKSGTWDPTAYSDSLDNSSLAPNFVKDPAAIEAQNAMSAWVETFLRDASGAAIPVGERLEYARDFFPMPGDTPQAVANKNKLRQQKMANAATGAGPKAMAHTPSSKSTEAMGAGDAPVSQDTEVEEVERKTADGKIAIFDAKTKKFLRYK